MPRRRATEPAAPAETPAEATDAPAQEEDYETRRKELLAKLPPEDKRPTSLYGKLALVSSLVGTIKKRGVNRFHGYNYATEADLVEAIRPLLAELGIWVWSSLYIDDTNVHPHQRVKIGDQAEVDSLTILMVAFRFYDQDGNSTDIQVFPGYGDDTGDKGAYKALTGAEKYFLMKTFLVATGDDPEADNRADDRAAARDAATSVRVGSAPRGQRPARHGGRQASPPQAQVRVLGETLRAAGYTTTTAAIAALTEITGKAMDLPEGVGPAEALQKFISELSADEIGEIIRKLQEKPGPDADVAADDRSDVAPDPDDSHGVDAAPDDDPGPYS